MAESHRLEHAPDAMTQMEADKNHRDYIKEGSDRVAETTHHVFIRAKLGKAGMNRTRRKMQEVANHEDGNERTTHHHRSRSQTALHIPRLHITNRTRRRFQ